MATVAEKRRIFRDLHADGCFVIPNPFDVGSARWLQSLGFKALATTSSGVAFAEGLPDGGISRDDMLAHIAALVEASDVPVNADFLNAFADDPAGVAANVTRGVATGVAAISIEDSTGNADAPLYDSKLAIERIRAARSAIDATGSKVMLVGRCEGFLVGETDLNKVIARLVAYAEAGSDCLYAPGLRSKEQIAAVVKAVAPKPVNVLMGGPGFSVAELADLGVRRISVGGAMARAAWGGFMRSAREIVEKGSFGGFANAAAYAELNAAFERKASE
jgi:methylisocitrate lyase